MGIEAGNWTPVTRPVCPLCVQPGDMWAPFGCDEVPVCEDCWSPHVYYLRGDLGTVVVSAWDRKSLEKRRRGESA